jgi:hypothetical protein
MKNTISAAYNWQDYSPVKPVKVRKSGKRRGQSVSSEIEGI